MSIYDLTEREYEDLWLKHAEFGNVDGFPALAPEDVQARLHGLKGDPAMRDALSFRRVVKQIVGEFPRGSKYLDFGCGWGRHMRIFLKDFEPRDIYGVDIDPDNIVLIEELLPDVNAVLSIEDESIPLPDNSMDLILSYSVFSHINEESALFWFRELARLLKPGGWMIVTSWGKGLFEIFDRHEATGGKVEYPWEANISRAFEDKDEVKRLYNAGDYVFGNHGSTSKGLDSEVYGISLLPKEWIENNTDLHVTEWIEDTAIVSQTTFFLQKKL